MGAAGLEAYYPSGHVDVSKDRALSVVPSNQEIALPFPERKSRREMVPFLLALGLCLVPVFLQVVPLAKAKMAVGPGPTDSVVEALSRSVMTPAFARAKYQLTALDQPLDAIIPGQLQEAGKSLFLGPVGDRARAVECLALAAWYEAGNDAESQRSVMQVVLNRVAHPSFPKSVCGVVFQGSQRRTGCQFTFTCDGSMLQRRPSPASLGRARVLAEMALQGNISPSVRQATHYHADYVLPWWASKLVPRAKVGRHIFYSWPGKLGILPGQPKSAGEADLALLINRGAGQQTGLPPADQPASANPAAAAVLPRPVTSLPPGTDLPAAPPATKPSSTIMLAIDAGSPNGRWAVLARGSCAGKTGCRVLGYETQDQIARNAAAGASSREKPIFLFVRDAASGIELALWDCEKVQRPASSQCLPGMGRELTRLLRDSQS